MPYDGVLENLAVHISGNNMNGNTVVTANKNGSATTITITIGAGVTGNLYDNTHTASFAQGDSLDTHVDTLASQDAKRTIISASYEYVKS
ncbi:MAG: hypothetical protein MUP55_02760 [Candidatus Aenigmarchaeota archaeon]|nr:hypothetical protein [Candidatus Aenigmarchaeota archaeon]